MSHEDLELPSEELVGPILQTLSEFTPAITRAIQELNPGAVIIDRGSYLRVLVPGYCRLCRESVESWAGRPFILPGDLETAMSSFRGKIRITETEATWTAAGRNA